MIQLLTIFPYFFYLGPKSEVGYRRKIQELETLMYSKVSYLTFRSFLSTCLSIFVPGIHYVAGWKAGAELMSFIPSAICMYIFLLGRKIISHNLYIVMLWDVSWYFLIFLDTLIDHLYYVEGVYMHEWICHHSVCSIVKAEVHILQAHWNSPHSTLSSKRQFEKLKSEGVYILKNFDVMSL